MYRLKYKVQKTKMLSVILIQFDLVSTSINCPFSAVQYFLPFTLAMKNDRSAFTVAPKMNKKNIIFIMLAFSRTNILIALLYTGTRAVWQTVFTELDLI